ncbi:SMI1/KNR4 family protein [Streptomyces virginiae]|uniref:SMI1/KNR4 family protein n=1 Tax=Streptomyces virginiae TaxID=1961 RepID=UPI003652BE7B
MDRSRCGPARHDPLPTSGIGAGPAPLRDGPRPCAAHGPHRPLRESDGIEDEYGDGLIWSAEQITAENRNLRGDAAFSTLYMPFDPLLFFADAGNGDLFALLARIDRPDVFVWNHEDDSRTWVAPRLATYLEWRLTGKFEL